MKQIISHIVLCDSRRFLRKIEESVKLLNYLQAKVIGIVSRTIKTFQVLRLWLLVQPDYGSKVALTPI